MNFSDYHMLITTLFTVTPKCSSVPWVRLLARYFYQGAITKRETSGDLFLYGAPFQFKLFALENVMASIQWSTLCFIRKWFINKQYLIVQEVKMFSTGILKP